MSGGTCCRCHERHEPIAGGFVGAVKRPGRLWRVISRECNYSRFNGSHYTPSNWSSVCCLRCGAHWRTKAGYVHDLADRLDEEINICPGTADYRHYMEMAGRRAWRHREAER